MKTPVMILVSALEGAYNVFITRNGTVSKSECGIRLSVRVDNPYNHH